MESIVIIIGVVQILLLIAVLVKKNAGKSNSGETAEYIRSLVQQTERNIRSDISENIRIMGENTSELQKTNFNAQSNKLNDIDNQMNQKINDLKMQINREITALKSDTASKLDMIQKTVDNNLQGMLDEKMSTFGKMLSTNQQLAGEAQSKQIGEIASKIDQNLNNMSTLLSEKQEQTGKAINDSLKNLENRFSSLESNNEQKLENIRTTMSRQLTSIQEENQKKLDSIQNTVNEKLESQLQKSFRLVSEQLETVHKSLGEMQTIASGVGDLKRVLSNVKTRGILGEIQLGSILSEILAPEQYETEIPTIAGSKDRVEFAIKLPGNETGKTVYLPIDSKFPGDTYEQLLSAYESCDKLQIETAKKNLVSRIKSCAKDIKEKYVAPPYTTNFGIMFLPFEGLYAEVVNLGMIETLQREYNINVAGPSTMAAMLNSLQMGFKTLAIQKKSNEVWQVLGAVKKEFGTFQDVLDKAQKQIQSAGDSIDKLIGTRTRAINRKLSTVEILDDYNTTQELLDLKDDV